MSENRNLLLKAAMTYGFSMGIYWVIKYIFFILGISSTFSSIIYMLLTGLVPFIAFYMTWRYKIEAGGQISFFHAWQFGILLYFFAALIVSLVHYVFYAYLAPPGFLANSMEQTVELLKNSHIDPKLLDNVSQVDLSPIKMAIQGIFNNVFYGVILSLPVAFIIIRLPQNPLPPGSFTNTNQ